jgi:hypothetical protein
MNILEIMEVGHFSPTYFVLTFLNILALFQTYCHRARMGVAEKSTSCKRLFVFKGGGTFRRNVAAGVIMIF